MISVEQAIQIIESKTNAIDVKKKRPLSDALGFVLAEDVVSPIDMPPFRQSAMDGYAVRIHDSEYYNIIGELQAGDGNDFALNKGDAVRIFTGAPVPNDADSIVIQEKATVKGQQLQVCNELVIESNIRTKGEQIRIGELAMKKSHELTAAAIGFLATLGITAVWVNEKPSVGIIATGNELVEPGSPLEYGQIYESNSMMLCAALEKLGHKNSEVFKISDDYSSTLKLLKALLSEKDVVIVTGGISVGDYDFVGRALQELEVKQLFYKVKQKPGKPLYFGKKDETYVFALPGNPAAALSCFYVYVERCLKSLMGNHNIQPTTIMATSVSQYHSKGSRAQFLKAYFQNGEAQILEGQSSSMLHTFAVSNALLYLPETTKKIEIGDRVALILIS